MVESAPDRYERIESAFISRYWSWVFMDPEKAPGSLGEVLKIRLPHIDCSSWDRRLAWGGAYVNGSPAFEDRPLPFPCRVEYYEPKFDLEDAHNFFPSFSDDHVLFEDDDLIVVFKPAGLPCVPAREQQHYNLKVYVERYLGRVVHMPSRLDMSTQGIVIMSKHERMHAAIQRVFQERSIRKTYLLEARGSCDWKSRAVEAPIGRDPSHPVLRRTWGVGAKPATTLFSWIARQPDGGAERHGLLEAIPLTGRTHQIRVHSSSIGLPIVGDNFYGGAPAERLRLVSFRLELGHPLTSRLLRVELPERFYPAWLRAWLPGAS